MPYSNQEKARIFVWWIESQSSYAVFRRRVRREMGRHAQVPKRDNVIRWNQMFVESGSVQRKDKKGTKWVRTDQKKAEVLSLFTADRHSSPRSVAMLDGMPSRRTIQRILKEMKFHPYKLRLNHALRPRDLPARVAFSRSQLALFQADPSFLDNLVFCDEAHFHLKGGVNRHNFRYWDDENRHWFEAIPLHSPRVTVFALLGRSGVVGPVFIQGTSMVLHISASFKIKWFRNFSSGQISGS